jgi:hypothetical protein
MRNLSFFLLAVFPLVLFLVGSGCSGSAIGDSGAVPFAGDGIEASADQRM